MEIFSESYSENEILLRDIEVFRNETGDLIYTVSGTYFTRNKSNLTLEFPDYSSGKKENENV